MSTHPACLVDSTGIHDIAVDRDDTIFVSSYNKTVLGIFPSGWRTTVSGQHDESGRNNGLNARFGAIQGISIDHSGALVVADTYNHLIRSISKTGFVGTLMGIPGSTGSRDGGKQTARFHMPYDVLVGHTSNDIFVLDHGNDSIRVIHMSGFVPSVRTLAGGTDTGFRDGKGGEAQFDGPTSMAMDIDGSILVTDTHNDALRRVTMDGTVTTVAGFKQSGPRVKSSVPTECLCAEAIFKLPRGVIVDGEGTIIVSDSGHKCLRKIKNGVVTHVAGTLDGKHYSLTDGPGPKARFGTLSKMALDAYGRLLVLDTTTTEKDSTVIRIVDGGFVPLPGMASQSSCDAKEITRKLAVLERFGDMIDDTRNTDIMLQVEGEFFPAHRVVLCSQSTYFANILHAGMSEDTLASIKISQVTAAAFRVVLKYIYTSKISMWGLDQSLQIDIIKAADMMQLEGLLDHCMEVFHGELTVANVVQRLTWAYIDGPLVARDIAKKFFSEHARTVKVSFFELCFHDTDTD